MEVLKKYTILALENFKDKKTTGIGIALFLSALLSAGVITKEQISAFMDNFNTILLFLGGTYFTGFVGKNKNSKESGNV